MIQELEETNKKVEKINKGLNKRVQDYTLLRMSFEYQKM